MADHHDYLALDWVRGEIQETLNQAQQTLESYVENPADSSRMRFCQTYLHQVHGTLKMVEFYGAALLAEEMEKLAEAILNQKVASEGDAQETLMRAILQLPPYLDRVQAGRRDLPVVLLPLLNDLRAVRGEALLSETSLFKPDLSTLDKSRQAAPAGDDSNFHELAKKLRQMYQIALLGLLRNKDSAQQLVFMARVFVRLEQVSGKAPLAPLWSIVAALVEGLREQGIELGVSVKMMLGQVDRVLRQLAQDGAERLQEAPPNELLKNLLYYVAKSTQATPRVQQVRERFRLADALPSDELINEERARLSGPDQAAMSSVVQALSEELGKVKAALERHIQEGAKDIGKLEEQIAGLKQVGDTLAVLGLGQPREQVEAQLKVLRAMMDGSMASTTDKLMDVAGELLSVESTLTGLASGNRMRLSDEQLPDHIVSAREAVLRECQTGLEEAKDGIVEFIASQWDRQHLTSVPERLSAVRGGLELVQLHKPALILRQCVSFIAERLLPEDSGKPDWRSMDTLADAITSVEYYLERLSDDPGSRDDILKIARSSVATLGYPLADEDFASQTQVVALSDTAALEDELSDLPAASDEIVVTADAEAADFELDETQAVGAPQDSQTDELTLEDIHFDAPATEDTSFLLEESTAAAEPVADAVDAEDADAEDISLTLTPPEAPTPAPVAPVVEDSDDLIDDEIIEIFVEEAGEVLEALNEYFPRWAANTSDKEALTEFRRAFHTLKGSGRMVGASVVGELAWSIENMMNRVIDNTITPTPVLIELVRKVHGVLPQLVADFAERRPSSLDITPFMDAANILANGGQISAVPSLGAAAVEVDEPELEVDAATPEEDVITMTAAPVADEDGDETLLDIFISEAESNLAELKQWLDSLDRDFDQHPLDDLVHRCLHTMKGSARMAGVKGMAELAEPAEKCVKEMINMSVPANHDMLELLAETHDLLHASLPGLHASDDELVAHLPGADGLIERYQSLRERLGSDGERSIDRRLLEVFLSEGMDIILDAEGLLERWAANPDHTDELLTLGTELRLLSGSADTAGLKEVHDMAARLASCYQTMLAQTLTPDEDFLTLARAGQEALINMMDCLAAGQTVHAGVDILARFEDWLLGVSTLPPAAKPLVEELPEDDVADSSVMGADEVIDGDIEEIDFSLPATTDVEVTPASLGRQPDAAEMTGELLQDEELGEIFLEEAEDILAQSQEVLDAWHEDGDLAKVAELQRHLHTLKGGARMAGISHVGNLAHELEFLYEELALGQREAAPGLYGLLLACHDRLAGMVDQLRRSEPVFAASDLLDTIEQARGGHASTPPEAATSTPFVEGMTVTDNEDAIELTATAPEAEASAPETEIDSNDSVPDDIQDAIETAPVAEPDLPMEAPAANSVTAEVNSAAAAPVDRDPELVAIFLEEAEEILEAAGESFDSWLEAPDNLVEVQSLQRDLHTLKGGARMAEVAELGNLSHELENLYEGLGLGRLDPAPVLFELLRRCHDRLAVMVDAIKKNEPLQEAEDLIAQIRAYMTSPEDFELPAADGASATAAVAVSDATPVAPPVVTTTAPETMLLPADVDRDILGIFLEEASELSQSLSAALQQWQTDPADMSQADELKRVLHTLKGGARLAGLVRLGDLSHDAETLIEAAGDQVDASFFARLAQHEDAISQLLEQIQAAAQAMPETPQVAVEPASQPQTQVAAVATAPQAQPRRAQKAAQQQPQEMVRIGADVLEALVNLAGETSINRGRVEQGVGEFTAHINEMGNTVERLYEQLRRLDIETEAQIMSNYKQGVESGQYGEDFDPLEMDQYSELHQITKQLSESASDLLDLRNSLIDQTRDTETLLLQQSRINTELQEKLMRTRMVPFSRLVPRLRRIVRQVSGELGKEVDFSVINPEGELDRTLMERIVAPLEHMLRNAVDHGVEMPDKRTAAGKASTGNINLELGRDGGDVLLVLSDDGGGINTDAVRKKAIERGLINADSDITEQEMQQFIFSAGFSTAEQVTQISGRGVGMDVVASDIKQMGGSVSIESTRGKGTRFVVRLPFTLAMNRALLVRVGDAAYAIPLTQVEGIVRISPYELEAYLGEEAEDYSYAGQHYDLDYLGQYVHDMAKPNLEGVTSPLPVLLLHSQEHQVALVVDSLIGSREIVVKSVGPQLSTVAGISGATILGDGSVVIILDIHSLIRAAHLQRQALASGKLAALPQAAQPETIEDVQSGLPLIMVTDDSVTVRKVTTRLLERHGFEVMTAKDGVDAVAKLEERRPDLMLLDIEMPRMDGFEVASHMRHDSRFIDVPIIMITSRTGDKHRERAFDIGVNSYLGKPFQEGELLETIRELLAVKK